MNAMLPSDEDNQVEFQEEDNDAPKQSRNLDASFSKMQNMLVESAEVHPINLSEEKQHPEEQKNEKVASRRAANLEDSNPIAAPEPEKTSLSETHKDLE